MDIEVVRQAPLFAALTDEDAQALLQRMSRARIERGDILFVPQSAAGRAGDGVEVYFNQLLPFARSFGVSVSKEVR